jgi:hypothetical protein
MNTFDILALDFVRRETDIADEAYCIECGLGGMAKGSDSLNFYFYEGQGPFCRRKCFADFLGVEEDKLPPLKYCGSLKKSSYG